MKQELITVPVPDTGSIYPEKIDNLGVSNR